MAKTYRLSPGTRLINSLFRALTRLGLGASYRHILTVPGRKTGRLYSTPVDIIELDDQRWLVAAYGPTNWVRNVEPRSLNYASSASTSRTGQEPRTRSHPAACQAKTFAAGPSGRFHASTHGFRCPFQEQTTSRGYETGTSARARPVTRGHGRHVPNPRFPGEKCSRMTARARRYRLKTSMVRRGSTVRVRQRASQKASKWPFLLSRRRTYIARASLSVPPRSVPNISGAREFWLEQRRQTSSSTSLVGRASRATGAATCTRGRPRETRDSMRAAVMVASPNRVRCPSTLAW